MLKRFTASASSAMLPTRGLGAASDETASASAQASVRTKLDTSMFTADKFDLDSYLRSILPNNSEDGVREQFRLLTTTKEQVAVALQQNMQTGYNEFIRTSKQIAQLESDINSLQQLLADFKSVGQEMLELSRTEPAELKVDDQPVDSSSTATIPSDSDHSQTKQIDTVVLERRQAEMAAVKAAVDGAQLYLESLDRYLLREDDLVELNIETYQPVQVVHIYTFNDGLLIAVPRKSKPTTRRKSILSNSANIEKNKAFVAEQFLHFQGLAVVNMKDVEGLRNAVKLMKHPDSYVYKTASKDDKLRWLLALKTAMDDFMRSAARRGTEVSDGAAASTPSKNRRLSMLLSGKASKPNSSAKLVTPAVTSKEQATDITHDDDGGMDTLTSSTTLESLGLAPANVPVAEWKTIYEQLDELDVMIAQRQFDLAVLLISQLRCTLAKYPMHAQNVNEVRRGVEQRVTLLASRLCWDLSTASVLSHAHLRSHIKHLLALGLPEQARDIYLRMRSVALKDHIRKLKFEGDIVAYIQDLSNVVFRFLLESGHYYWATFRNSHLSSGFVLWAIDQLEEYAAIFRRYVFYHHSFRAVVDCLRIAAEHCVDLRNSGYDLLFFIEKSFHGDICNALDSYRKRSEATIVKLVSSDRWVPTKEKRKTLSDGTKARVSITSSVVDFELLVRGFMEDVEDVYSINLYVPIVTFITSTFEKFMRQMQEVCEAKMLRDTQALAIVENAIYVVAFLYSEAMDTLKTRFDRDVPELEKLRRRLEATEGVLVESYAKRRAEDLANVILDAAENGFVSSKKKASAPKSLEPPDFVSVATEKVIDAMRVVSTDVGFVGMRDRIMTALVLQLVTRLSEAPFDRAGKFAWNSFSVHQMILDLHVLMLMLAPPAPGASPLVPKELQRCIENVAKGYLDPTRPKKNRGRDGRKGREDDGGVEEGEGSQPATPISPTDRTIESAEWFSSLAQKVVVDYCEGQSLEAFWTGTCKPDTGDAATVATPNEPTQDKQAGPAVTPVVSRKSADDASLATGSSKKK